MNHPYIIIDDPLCPQTEEEAVRFSAVVRHWFDGHMHERPLSKKISVHLGTYHKSSLADTLIGAYGSGNFTAN